MKRVLSILIAVTMLAMVMVGCGGGQGGNTTTTSPSATETATTPAETATQPEATEAATPPATEAVEDTDTVSQAAYDYFKNFPSDNNVVKPEDLLAMIDSEEDMLIVDIRRPEDYQESHLKGAVNISFFDMSISDSLEKLPDDKPIMVYCYTGQTASQTAALLNIAGKMAKNVQSGFNNGISKAEGFENYLDTEAVTLEDGNYPVDEAIKAAIADYYSAKMSKDGTKVENNNISAESVKEIVDSEDDSYYILSIRQAEDYAQGHIKGAANIPFGQGMEEELVKLPMDKTIIVYCYSGQTSSQTVAVLRLMGYEAYTMSGGMGNAEAGTGWLGEGYEVVTD